MRKKSKEPPHCGKCGRYFEKNDRYCRWCGKKRGDVIYIPKEMPMYPLYGPPFLTNYHCENCGEEYEDTTLGGVLIKYCPFCGFRITKDSVFEQKEIDW